MAWANQVSQTSSAACQVQQVAAETWAQANARIARPGQKLNTLIVSIQGSDIERVMYERLGRRESMQGTLLGMFE
jgi:hypothetical protein